jgi:hypothetical protein
MKCVQEVYCAFNPQLARASALLDLLSTSMRTSTGELCKIPGHDAFAATTIAFATFNKGWGFKLNAKHSA